MSVGVGKPGYVPNWIRENDWSAEKRLEWIRTIMATDSRDWSMMQNGDSGYPDPTKWAIWCLACCDTKNEATNTWNDFCKEHNQ